MKKNHLNITDAIGTGEDRTARIDACLGSVCARNLRRKCVAVVGVGALGGPVLQHLAMLAIQEMILIDPGLVEEPNLGNQCFDAGHVGMTKVAARREQIARIHPSCTVCVYPVRLETLGWGILARADLVICCLDNLAGRIRLNEICSHLQLPWIDGATDGSGRLMFGRVASFGSHPDAPCFICSFDQRQLTEALSAERRGCRSWWNDPNPSPPTLSVSPECAVIAGLQCIEAIKRLTETISPSISTEMLVDLDSMRMQPVELQRNLRCLNSHKPFGELIPVDRSLSIGATLAWLQKESGMDSCIRLYKRIFISHVRCVACGGLVPVGLLDSAFTPDKALCSCGNTVTPNPHSQHDTITRENAEGFLERSWNDIGLADREIMSGCVGENEVHLIAVKKLVPEEKYHD